MLDGIEMIMDLSHRLDADWYMDGVCYVGWYNIVE